MLNFSQTQGSIQGLIELDARRNR